MLNLIATAPMGLEAVVAHEVRTLGYEPVVENGRVRFAADAAAICRANLWLRTADRVLVQVGEFTATSFEALFEGTKALPWADWLPADATFPVAGRSHQSQLSSVPAVQGVVKKAIVESLKQRHRREWFEETGAKFGIEITLLKDTATLTLDTTGPGLHKRGYRKLTAAAPIKETLAAALLLISRWYPDRPLIDPCCGSGTIPVEAALIAHRVAPGLHRSFDAEHWPRVGADLWAAARAEAHDAIDGEAKPEIFGSDIDPEVLSLARYHARAAGVAASVHFEQRPAAAAESSLEYGFLITNPPYGERLGERPAVEALYADLGRVLRRLPTWSAGVLTAHPGFERHFGRAADKRRKLYNGRIECQYFQYTGPRRPRPVSAEAP